MELLSEESTIHDKLPYKTGAHVCGGVVDRNSGKGLVTITGKGFITQTIPTGPDETGNRYQEINIQPKQTCMIHGDAVVLYYKCRTVSNPLHSLQPTPSQKNAQSVAISTSPIEIVVRLQMDGSGKFSTPFDKSVLRPKLTTTEFFSWFSTQTRCGGSYGPLCLKFTFKDAMPTPKATEVARGNEDHFNYMRKDIKTQCEKARAYMPDLKEFVVLVTVPSSPVGEEEEEWRENLVRQQTYYNSTKTRSLGLNTSDPVKFQTQAMRMRSRPNLYVFPFKPRMADDLPRPNTRLAHSVRTAVCLDLNTPPRIRKSDLIGWVVTIYECEVANLIKSHSP
jgi:hypothetical protein